jgi:single-strand DNA-binding protein
MAKKRDMNVWHGTGRFGRKPEVMFIPSGKAVCSVSIACQVDDKTEWVALKFWDKQAELVGQYCDKGSFVRVSGRLQTREWEKDGVKRYTTEVVVNELQFLERGNGQDKQAERKQEPDQRVTAQETADVFGGKIVDDDDLGKLPF